MWGSGDVVASLGDHGMWWLHWEIVEREDFFVGSRAPVVLLGERGTPWPHGSGGGGGRGRDVGFIGGS